eukprot:313040_1
MASYQQQQGGGGDEEEEFQPLIIGDTLNKIRDEMNNKFNNVAQNMEKQLTRLRRELEKEKQTNSDLRRQLKNSQDQCEEFKQENQERQNDLNQINAFYNSNADDTEFDNLLNEVQERHQALAEQLQSANYNKNINPMNKAWQDEIYKISQNIKGSANASEQAAIVDELKNRTNELETIKKIMNGDEPVSVLEDIADSCEERHAAQTGDPMSTYKAPGNIEDPDALKDNDEWEQLLRDFVKNPPKGQGADALGTRNDLFLQELGDRIGDLREVKDIFNKKKDENIPKEDIEDQARNLLLAVGQRHNDQENKVQNTLNLNNDDDTKKLVDFKDNDTTWRHELGNIVDAVVDKKEEPEEVWWLDQDQQRRQVYDGMIVEQQDHDILMKDAVYLNRELPDEKSDFSDYTNLYIPIDPINKHRVFGTLYDAAECCDFLAKVNPDMIDSRVVHRPSSLEEPYPLTERQVLENVNLLLASCKAMALILPSYQAHTWLNRKLHAPLLVAVLHNLCKERLKNYVNMEKHPEIIRLLTASELNDDPEKIRNLLTADEVLKRWINMSLGRSTGADIGNYGADLYNTLRKNDPNFANKSPALNNGIMNKAAAEAFINFVRNDMGIDTNIQPEDVLDGNLKLEELMAAQIFDLNNGLAPLSSDEQNKYKAFWTDDNPNDDAYLPWLNSQLPPHMKIGNLYRDLSDGIILAHILERSNPGSINWKKMRKQIRHKFDKVANCNYVYDVMKKKFPFTLVGIAGPDIVDGRQKYIHTILWQIMRYQATKQLSALAFDGKSVTDKDILKWSTETHEKLQDKRAKTAKSFRDRSLTTCVFYIELLKVISDEGFVNDDLVDYDVEPLASSQDEFMKERCLNARYCISLIRRYGGDVFLLPEDLVIMEPKAVLSVYAAIMTIDFQLKTKPKGQTDYNQNGNMDDIQQAEDALYKGGFSG